MPFGLTYKSIDILCDRLSNILLISSTEIKDAMDQITREEVARIARNEIQP